MKYNLEWTKYISRKVRRAVIQNVKCLSYTEQREYMVAQSRVATEQSRAEHAMCELSTQEDYRRPQESKSAVQYT